MYTADPWIERHIAARTLSPGARGMDRAGVAGQYNAANALTPADPDFLFTPDQAQPTARAMLNHVGITVGDGTIVVLTDADDTGPDGREYRINVGQLEGACEQHRLVSGNAISADAIVAALPWAEPQW